MMNTTMHRLRRRLQRHRPRRRSAAAPSALRSAHDHCRRLTPAEPPVQAVPSTLPSGDPDPGCLRRPSRTRKSWTAVCRLLRAPSPRRNTRSASMSTMESPSRSDATNDGPRAPSTSVTTLGRPLGRPHPFSSTSWRRTPRRATVTDHRRLTEREEPPTARRSSPSMPHVERASRVTTNGQGGVTRCSGSGVAGARDPGQALGLHLLGGARSPSRPRPCGQHPAGDVAQRQPAARVSASGRPSTGQCS